MLGQIRTGGGWVRLGKTLKTGGTEKKGREATILERGGQAGSRDRCLKKRVAGNLLQTMSIIKGKK